MSQKAQQGERELMPEGEMYAPVDFGPYLVGLVHLSRERPTLHVARPGEREELCRKDPFPIPKIPNGHSHALARRGAQDQVPFAEGVRREPLSLDDIFWLALMEMEPVLFKDWLRTADAGDVADVIPNDVIEAATRQYRELHERLPA